MAVVCGDEHGSEGGVGGSEDDDGVSSDLISRDVVGTVLTTSDLPEDSTTVSARSTGGACRCSLVGTGTDEEVLRTVVSWRCPAPGLITFSCFRSWFTPGGGWATTSSWLCWELADPDVFMAITGFWSGCSTATPAAPLNTAAIVPNSPTVATLAAANASFALVNSTFPANASPSVDGTTRYAALDRNVAQTSFSSVWSCVQAEQVSRWARIRRYSTPWTPPAV